MSTHHCEVLIIGAGSMGMAAGYFLAKRGIQTILVDANDPPHVQGSHHGETRLFRYAYQDQIPYVPLALRSLGLWKELEAETAHQILNPTGVLSVSIDDHASLEAKVKAAQEHSLPVECFSRDEILRRWPGFVLPESAKAILEVNAGILAPEKAIHGYRMLAKREGAALFTHTPAEKIIYGSHGVEVHTKDQTFFADKLLLSSGAGNAHLLKNLSLPLRVVRKTVGWFHTKGMEFRHPAFPGFVITKGKTDYYGFPDFDGGGLKIGRHDGGQRIRTGESILPFGSYPEDEQDLRQCLNAYMPAASGPFAKGSTCLYTVTPDEHFVIDQHPEYQHVFIAAGFSGHGFKFASAIGEALSEILIDGKANIDLSLFSLARFV